MLRALSPSLSVHLLQDGLGRSLGNQHDALSVLSASWETGIRNE
jgi:hypothetical protein